MTQNFERTQEIIETLRADIDFELDDSLAKIVNGLPESYFRSFSNLDLLKPLKALLALRICNLDDEILLRSEDQRHLTVVANQNYPGQLAGILKQLPDDVPLLGARVFTSKDHDFIIDLFEFKMDSTEQPPANDDDVQDLVEDVSKATGKSIDVITDFVSHYDRHNRILKYPEQVAEQFLAFGEIEHSRDVAVRWNQVAESSMVQLTVSLGSSTGKHVFMRSAEFLGEQKLDIERAWLDDIFPPDDSFHVAIASFLVDVNGKLDLNFDLVATELESYIKAGFQPTLL
jgi:hypothetical protein